MIGESNEARNNLIQIIDFTTPSDLDKSSQNNGSYSIAGCYPICFYRMFVNTISPFTHGAQTVRFLVNFVRVSGISILIVSLFYRYHGKAYGKQRVVTMLTHRIW